MYRAIPIINNVAGIILVSLTRHAARLYPRDVSCALLIKAAELAKLLEAR